ncbi:DUF4376 domain-containing protein [Azospirillum sp. Sh1]|uniref:DUF4376 domain-containing protein n=1 Tax=Azospirillum sp. Sh1 TaxID=2607285 RepID=UPI0011ED2563|nr:DUF4376 domain-containing protein [Azospirillum sp. Sh1]KAA0582683.1 DUF4376 domain-containing protein [Azospirillum sp. Sh1]
MQLPAIIVYPDGTRSVFHSPASFPYTAVIAPHAQTVTTTEQEPYEDPDTGAIVWRSVEVETVAVVGAGDVQTILHPPEAWVLWTPEDWAATCPGLTVRPVIDPGPQIIYGKRAVRLPADLWDIGDEVATVTYAMEGLTAEERAAQMAGARVGRVAAINEERDRRLAAGAPYGGKRIDVSDRGRADLGGMAIAAMLATAGTVPWTGGYSAGWITMDNTRFPLPTPADGLALSAAVGDWYGRTMQYARDMKDAVLSAADPAAIPIADGWPD